MDTIDNKINMEQFGAFIAQMRKERGLTQKEHYASKGVSKEVKRKRMYLYLLELVLVALEMVWLWHSVPPLNIVRDVLVVEFLPLLFGLYFFFFMKEKLPYYYDIDKISNYGEGAFRMNLPGVYFNNHNWQYILRTGRVYCFVTPVIYPLLYLFLVFVLDMLHHEEWLAMVNLPLCLIVVLGGLFIPMIIVGKKYE